MGTKSFCALQPAMALVGCSHCLGGCCCVCLSCCCGGWCLLAAVICKQGNEPVQAYKKPLAKWGLPHPSHHVVTSRLGTAHSTRRTARGALVNKHNLSAKFNIFYFQNLDCTLLNCKVALRRWVNNRGWGWCSLHAITAADNRVVNSFVWHESEQVVERIDIAQLAPRNHNEQSNYGDET